MLSKYFGLLLFVAGLWVSVYGDYFEECEGQDETYAAVQEDCSFYIMCHGEDSFRDSCPEESPYFSVVDQTCDTDKNVCGDRAFPNVDLESGEGTEETVTEAPSSNPPTNPTSSISISTPAVSSTSTSSTLPTTISSSIITSQTSTVATQPPTVTTTYTPSMLPSSCPAVDDPSKAVFLPHPKSCSEYFLCYHGERLPMHCSNMLHFDARQQKCDYPEKVKCYISDVVSPREQCLPHTMDVYPHPVNCNYYYQCLMGYLKVMQCPLNMGWHHEKRTCVLRSQAKCYKSTARN